MRFKTTPECAKSPWSTSQVRPAVYCAKSYWRKHLTTHTPLPYGWPTACCAKSSWSKTNHPNSSKAQTTLINTPKNLHTQQSYAKIPGKDTHGHGTAVSLSPSQNFSKKQPQSTTLKTRPLTSSGCKPTPTSKNRPGNPAKMDPPPATAAAGRPA